MRNKKKEYIVGIDIPENAEYLKSLYISVDDQVKTARRILALRYQDTFITDKLHRAAEIIIDLYDLKTLETIEKDDLANGLTGKFNFDMQALLDDCAKVNNEIVRKAEQ